MTASQKEAPSRQRVVRSGALDLAVFEHGDPRNETVILLHGWPDTHLLWQELVPSLADRFHVVTFDQRGHGLSSTPESWQDFAFEQLAEDVRVIARAVSPGKPVHLLGHDFGAIYAWEAVCDERADEEFASFICVAGTNLDHWGLWARKVLRKPNLRTIAGLVSQLLCSSYIFWLFVPGVPAFLFKRLGEPSVWRRVLRVISHVPPHKAHLSTTLAKDMLEGAQIYRANIGKLAHPRERRTRVPVLMILGKYDIAIRRTPLEDTSIWGQKVTFRDIAAGHWSPFTHPWEIAELASEFIDSHSPTMGGASATALFQPADER